MNNYKLVELCNYFNHKIIAKAKTIIKETKLDNIGIKDNFFVPEVLPESNTVFHIKDIPFLFPDKGIDQYDNIQCEEQVIDINKSSCKRIYILGFSELASYRDYINITYSDNTCEEVPIFFYGWEKAVTQLWQYDIKDDNCSAALISNISANKRRGIYIYECNIETLDKNLEKTISNIMLPYNPSIHILAITIDYEGEGEDCI